MKPFAVSSDWIYYAHNPGADSHQPAALELVQMAESAGYGKGRTVRVPAERPDLVYEVVSVAELYTEQRGDDAEGNARGRRASLVVRRGREWLAATYPHGHSVQVLSELLTRAFHEVAKQVQGSRVVFDREICERAERFSEK